MATRVFQAGALGNDHGNCVFHDANIEGGCRIQRALGHAALPLACRQFPRQSVSHPGGASVTLSHYCPTAAALLERPGAFAIVTNAPAFPASAEYVGLTADAVLPPLIHSSLAMDWDSWWLFESLSVSLFADTSHPLARLGLAVDRVREWSVSDGALAQHITDAFAEARVANVVPRQLDEDGRCADALAAVPVEWRDEAIEALSASGAAVADHAWRQFMAAHVFANWTAYLGDGLRAWYRSVDAAAGLVARTGDPGRVDLVLRHLADAHALTARWNLAE